MKQESFARAMLLGVLMTASGGGGIAAQSDQADRVRESATVFEEIMEAPDKAIPRSVLEKAEAIAVFPSTLKVGFIFGGHRGRGIISVHDRDAGRWSPPTFLTLTGGSFGVQIGGEAVDIVLGGDESPRGRESSAEPVQARRRRRGGRRPTGSRRGGLDRHPDAGPDPELLTRPGLVRWDHFEGLSHP